MPVDLPDPERVLTETNWAAMEHGMGPAADAPEMLPSLLDADQDVRSQALSYLVHVLNHQSTLYDSTVPAALYVAAVLADPRTALPVDKKPHDFPGPLRAELLGWLDSVANEVCDEAEAIGRRHGFPLEEYPPAVQTREIRPLLFRAVHACINDSDPHVREAAIAACMPLADDPRLIPHRATLAPLLRDVLATSKLWQYRERAIEALAMWGEDTAGLEVQREPFEVCDSELSTDSTSTWPAGPRFALGDDSGPPF
ncbi:HEAT repeat domain-containing protein [Streptomyces sp. NPDC005485]|uniref:HEAT repeat domain-containing protein n=1 Tax=Streptomyces sp. NPDC005485 TaxID=3155591 RepID=UPI0033B5B053